MKKVFKWIGRIFAFFAASIVLALIVGLIWFLFQPKVATEPIQLAEERLSSEDYRTTADSALLLFQAVAKDLQLPSLSVAVSIDDEVVWAAALGKADISKDRPSSLETRYRSGSVAKSMTGLASAKLVQMGKLELDKPIRGYLPDFPQKQWDPTLRQLASHTGGVRHYNGPGKPHFFAEQFSKHHYNSVEESLVLFKDDPLLFEPGTAFRYSTHSFTLLSAALEKASGMLFLDLVDELVWQPAGMTNTRPDDLTQEDPQRMIPYTIMGGRMIHSEGPDPSYKWAGGGILTTPSDLVKMGGAFMSGKISGISPQDANFQAVKLQDGSNNDQNYALGWRNYPESKLLGTTDTVMTMHHGGASPGGSSFLLMLPNDTIAASAMTNLSVRNAWPLREAVYKVAGMFRKEIKKKEAVKVEEGILVE